MHLAFCTCNFYAVPTIGSESHEHGPRPSSAPSDDDKIPLGIDELQASDEVATVVVLPRQAIVALGLTSLQLQAPELEAPHPEAPRQPEVPPPAVDAPAANGTDQVRGDHAAFVPAVDVQPSSASSEPLVAPTRTSDSSSARSTVTRQSSKNLLKNMTKQSSKARQSGRQQRPTHAPTIPGSDDDEDALKDLPLCPALGCSYAFLKQFAESEGFSAESMFSASVSMGGSGTFRSELKRWADGVARRASMAPNQKLGGKAGPGEAPSASKSMNASGDGDSFTMGSVCNTIIKPRTKCSRRQRRTTIWGKEAESVKFEALSYAELGLRLEMLDSTGKPAFAKATHFVSHAWKCNFTNFVEAIGFWLEQSGTCEATAYFWVDAFVVNQHQTQEFPQEWWSTRFMQAIGDIGNTVLVIEPWHHPVPLERAWVIWELYCTAKQQAKLHIAMSKNTLEEFKAALRDSFERVQTAMSYVDVSKSSAFHEHDRAMIHAEIQRTIGFTQMNGLVQTRLKQWLVEYVKGQLLEFQHPRMSMKAGLSAIQASENDRAAHFRLKENLARLLRESGCGNDAEDLLEDLLSEVEAAFGKDHQTSMSCLNQLAVTMQKLGKDEESLKRHRDCYERRMRVLGPGHEDTLQSTSNLAVLLSGVKNMTQKEFEEARQLYNLAISGREASVGPDHPRTLYTVSNLGTLMSKVPTLSVDILKEGEALHDRAVSGLIVALHEAHPLTLTAMHHQAAHWLAFRTFQEKELSEGRLGHFTPKEIERLQEQSYEQLRRVKTLRTEKLGKDHPDTVLTEQALARELFRLKRLETAGGWATAEMSESRVFQLDTV